MRGAAMGVLVVLLWCGAALAAEEPSTAPARAYLTRADGTSISGTIVRHDERQVTLRLGQREQTFAWSQFTPISAYLVRRRLVDLGSAQAHWQLGQFLLAGGEVDQARKEFAQAARLDGSYADRAAEALAGAAPAPVPPSAPASASGPAASQPGQPAPFLPAAPELVQARRELVELWARQTRQAIAPALHLVETPHFLIYSAWEPRGDAGLRQACEGMYAALCRQFDIDPALNIWVGKLPVFVFWEAEHYRQFVAQVDRSGEQRGDIQHAGAYQAQDGEGFSYIVLAARQNKKIFYATLVHEATHAFLARYINHTDVPAWLNEGLAETMAAELVEDAPQRELLVEATGQILKDDIDLRPLFQRVRLEALDYGAAQALVRYLIARDRRSFVRLIRLIKDGRGDEEALHEAYGLSRAELLRAWAQDAQAAMERRRRGK